MVGARMAFTEPRRTDGVGRSDTGENSDPDADVDRRAVLDLDELGNLEVGRGHPQTTTTLSWRRRSGLGPLGVHRVMEGDDGDRVPDERRGRRSNAASSDPARR